MILGTNNFPSRDLAIKYYYPYHGARAPAEVDKKIREAAIVIGPPPVKYNETLILIDNGYRYGIRIKSAEGL